MSVTLTMPDRLARAEEHLRLQREGYTVLARQAEAARIDTPSQYQFLLDKLHAQFVLLDKAEDAYARIQGAGAWVERRVAITAALMEEYRDRGPQYALLIERAADATLRAEQLSAAGRPVEAAEFRSASKGVLEAVQALQRYTESEKREVLDAAKKEAMLAVIVILERVIAPQQPQLWDEALAAVERQLPSGTEGA